MKLKYLALLICLLFLGVLSCGGADKESDGGSSEDPDELIIEVSASIADIEVDGDRSDWEGIQPLVIDADGDNYSGYEGCDVKGIYIAISPDRSTVYVMMDFHDGRPNASFASGITPDTIFGYGVQQGYQVHFSRNAGGGAYFLTIMARWDEEKGWYIWRTGAQMELTNFENKVRVAANEVLEFSMPYHEMGEPDELFFRGEVTSSVDIAVKDLIPDLGVRYWPRVHF